MASSLTSGAKARAIAELANWLAEIEHRGPTDPIAKAIDAAYAALQFSSEVAARNQICALLLTLATCPTEPPEEQRSTIRGFIASIQRSHVFGLDCKPLEASDAAIDAAIRAWGIARNTKKWKETAILLEESGFPRVETNTLRKGWDRREAKRRRI